MKIGLKMLCAAVMTAAVIAAAPADKFGGVFAETAQADTTATAQKTKPEWAPSGTALEDSRYSFYKIDNTYDYTLSGSSIVANNGTGVVESNQVDCNASLYKMTLDSGKTRIVINTTNDSTFASVCAYNKYCGEPVGVVRGSGTGEYGSALYFYPVYEESGYYYTVFDAGLVDASVINIGDVILSGTVINVGIFKVDYSGAVNISHKPYTVPGNCVVSRKMEGLSDVIGLYPGAVCIGDVSTDNVFVHDDKTHFPIVIDKYYTTSGDGEQTAIGTYTTKISSSYIAEAGKYYYGTKTVEWAIKNSLESVDKVVKLDDNYYYTYGMSEKDNGTVYIIYIYTKSKDSADYIAVKNKDGAEIDSNKRLYTVYKNIKFPDNSVLSVDKLTDSKNKYFVAIKLNNASEMTPDLSKFEFVPEINH